VTVVEHEIDEVLGGGGTGTTLNDVADNNSLKGDTGVMDLYRYHSTGATCSGVTSTPSFTTVASEVACYSIDGGTTSIAQMNQSGVGDFGDYTGSTSIQNFTVPGSQVAVYTPASTEFAMMESIGWDGATSVPEPSSMLLLGSGVFLTRLSARRGKRQAMPLHR
jgi:hypothetical protein